MENMTAVVDNQKLQEKANEYAQKGAEEVIREFYTGYNSPYKKAIEENLANRGFDTSFELPDVVASINESLSKEIDKIANTAVAKTFVPLVTKFLTRAEKEVNFSEVLQKFIKDTGFEYSDSDPDDYTVEFTREEENFIRLTISDGKDDYEIGLSNFDKYKKDKPVKKGWTIYTLPFRYKSETSQTMKISLDGATLEMPFKKGVLENEFVSYVARLVMAETKIYFDTRYFDEDMFPSNHCHC